MLMNKMLEYKGCTSSIYFSEDDGVFHGKIEDVDDLIVFDGRSVAELQCAFEAAVDDYLDWKKFSQTQIP